MAALAQFLPMIIAAVTQGAAALTSKDAKQSSSYSKGQQGNINDVLAQLRDMRGQRAGDITQNQGYQQGQNWLNNLFNDQNFFNAFEAPLQRQFEEQTVPGLANQFAGMGSGGALGSTAFRNQLAREGSNLSTNIAALRGGLQQQGANQQLAYAQQPNQNYLSLLQSIMNPTQNQYQPASAGPLGGFASALTAALPNFYSGQFGGGGNAGAGYNQLISNTAGGIRG